MARRRASRRVRGERVLMIAADDTDAAEQFAAELLGPKQSTDRRRRHRHLGRPARVGLGDRGRLPAVGSPGRLVAICSRPTPACACPAPTATAVLDELPDDRLAYAYLSPDGARALLGSRGLEPIDTFVDAAATEGQRPLADRRRSRASARRAQRSRSRTGRQTRPASSPRCPPSSPASRPTSDPASLAYLGLGDPRRSVDALLDQAEVHLARARRRLPPGVARPRAAGRVDIGKDLLPLLGSEVALSAAAGGRRGSGSDRPGSGRRRFDPLREPDRRWSRRRVPPRRALAELQEPVAKALAPPENGRVAVFETIQVAGVQARASRSARHSTSPTRPTTTAW